MKYIEWKTDLFSALQDKMLESGFTPNYVINHIDLLRSMCDTAYQYGRKEEEDGREAANAGDLHESG